MQLTQDPAAIGSINAQLATQKRVDTDRQLHALKIMLENDGLEGYQITEQAKAVLRQLVDTWSGRAGQLPTGVPEGLPALASGGRPVDFRSSSHDVTADRQAMSHSDDGDFPGDRESPSGAGVTSDAGSDPQS
jgi:hypothetical protein